MPYVPDTQQPVLPAPTTLRQWARELGFQQLGISGIDLAEDEAQLQSWLDLGCHGEMDYMARHGSKRSHPAGLVADTLSVLSLRMDYWPGELGQAETALNDPQAAYVSRYALGRDYHKLIRKRLQRLARRIEQAIGPFGYRVFTDSAPVLEKPLARNAGLGWPGKHTNLIHPRAGSWFFLGEIYTNLPLPGDPVADVVTDHCGNCARCIDICPTAAIVEPYRVDARRCISYLTIELHGAIPSEFRPLIGNRIYGCDDCQLVCPWNRFARTTCETDFLPRQGLNAATLLDLFSWNEEEFLSRTEGSPIRRIGYSRWLRNIAVALGNAPTSPQTIKALTQQLHHPCALVREHVEWAWQRHQDRASSHHPDT